VNDIEQIQERLSKNSLVEHVDKVGPKQHIRVETGLKYPDGSSIDVFLLNQDELVLSDLGQTMSWLVEVQVSPWKSKKRQAILEKSIELLNVVQQGGTLEYRPKSNDEIGKGLLLLAQACFRVADLNFTRRSSLQSTFHDDVEEFITDLDCPYEPNAEILGPYENLIKVDFLVHGRSSSSALLTLSSGNSSAAHQASNEILRKWTDLVQTNEHSRVTIFDDQKDIYRDDDLQRLRSFSTVVPFSDRESLQTLIAA
jgi:hypothetical protein